MREQNRSEKRFRNSGQSRRRGRTKTRIQASYPGFREEKTYPGVKFRFHIAPAEAVSTSRQGNQNGIFQREHVRQTCSDIPTDLLLEQGTSRQDRVGASRWQRVRMSSSIDKLTRTRARAEGVPPAADYRHGSSGGEVAWWWVG